MTTPCCLRPAHCQPSKELSPRAEGRVSSPDSQERHAWCLLRPPCGVPPPFPAYTPLCAGRPYTPLCAGRPWVEILSRAACGNPPLAFPRGESTKWGPHLTPHTGQGGRLPSWGTGSPFPPVFERSGLCMCRRFGRRGMRETSALPKRSASWLPLQHELGRCRFQGCSLTDTLATSAGQGGGWVAQGLQVKALAKRELVLLRVRTEKPLEAPGTWQLLVPRQRAGWARAGGHAQAHLQPPLACRPLPVSPLGLRAHIYPCVILTPQTHRLLPFPFTVLSVSFLSAPSPGSSLAYGVRNHRA